MADRILPDVIFNRKSVFIKQQEDFPGIEVDHEKFIITYDPELFEITFSELENGHMYATLKRKGGAE